jgi:hypothetical protein
MLLSLVWRSAYKFLVSLPWGQVDRANDLEIEKITKQFIEANIYISRTR